MVLREVHRKQYSGFGKFETAVVVMILLLIIIAISGLPFNQMKTKKDDEGSWTYKAEYISLRSVGRIANKKFVAWAENPIVIKAVKEANKKEPRTMEEIIRLDDKWVHGEFEEEWLAQFLENSCAQYLRAKQKGSAGFKNIYPEIFVVDRQGCIVAATNKTTDFWQGDEDKFIKAYAEGEGDIYIGQAAFDESAELPLIQVSVPVLDPNSQQAIGVMVVGLDVYILYDQM